MERSRAPRAVRTAQTARTRSPRTSGAKAMRMRGVSSCCQHRARLHDDLAIALVTRPMLRLLDIHPAHLIHLVVMRIEAAAARLHQEVVDVLEDAHQRLAGRVAP